MKLTIDVDALTTRHSFSGGGVDHLLEIRIFGNKLSLPVNDQVIEAIDLYISEEVATPSAPKEVRREYPPSYDEGVDYEFGSLSYSDMEDDE